MTNRDQDRALERLAIEHGGASLQVQLADTAGAVRATALDHTGAVYEIDDAGHSRLVRTNGTRYTAGKQDHLFNAPATIAGQTSLGGIE